MAKSNRSGKKSWLKRLYSKRRPAIRYRRPQLDVLERRDLLIATPVKFDFGSSSYVESGHNVVTSTTTYNSSQGYGWDSSSGLTNGSNSGYTNDLRRDYVQGTVPRDFRVDLANGTYDVTVMLGAAISQSSVQLTAEGTVIDTVTSSANEFYIRTFPVTVSDGQLNLIWDDLGSSSDRWLVGGVEISPAASTPSPLTSLRVDLGTTLSPVMSGYEGMDRFRHYSPVNQFGWLHYTPTGMTDDGSGTDNLYRDYNEGSSSTTFVADLANGDYEVTLSLGDETGSQSNTSIYLEGALADTVSTGLKQFYTHTYPVTISDGQFTLTISGSSWHLNEITILPAVSPAGPFTAKSLDFGPVGSSLMSGYEATTWNSMYSPSVGYGWQDLTIYSALNASGDNLKKDYVYGTHPGTFVAQVPNGVYNVSVVMGASNYSQSNVRITIEGSTAATFSTTTGNYYEQTFQATVNDGQLTVTFADLDSSSKRWLLNALSFQAQNSPPVGVNDSYNLTEDQLLSIAAPGVLANDSDPDQQPLSVVLADTTSVYGVPVSVQANGSFTYDPRNSSTFQSLRSGQSLNDSFGYTVGDGTGLTSAANVALQVSGVNDAPVVSGPVTSTVTEEVGSYLLNLLAGASDVDSGDTLSIANLQLVSGNDLGIVPSGNSLWVYPYSYSYLTAGQSAVITYAYNVIDAYGGSTPQTAVITITGVNHAPAVANPVYRELGALVAGASVPLLSGASDPDPGDILNVTNLQLVSGNGSGITLSDNQLLINNASYQYLTAGQAETIQYSYQIIDSYGATVNQTATIKLHGQSADLFVDAGQFGFSHYGFSNNGSVGFGGSQYTSAPNSGSYAVWSFTDLPAGTYDVFVTWNPTANAAASAPFTVQENGVPLTTATLNQSLTPSGASVAGRPWESLGTFSASGTLSVRLDATNQGITLADAVRITPRVSAGSDLRAKRLFGDGESALFRYDVYNQDSAPFDVKIYRSQDGIALDALLATHTVSTAPDLAVGLNRTVSIPLSFVDVQEDYFLVAVVDEANTLAEEVETNNRVVMDQGVFRTPDGVVHVHGTSSYDTISLSEGSTFDVSLNGVLFQYSLASVSRVHVRAHAGGDSIYAAYNTPIWGFGGAGNDYLIGSNADDYLHGGRGSDFLLGYGGADTLVGGAGQEPDGYGYGGYYYGDSLYGGAGDDTLWGDNGPGDDESGEGDELYGEDGDDALFGQAGRDWLFGGAGNDTLDGGADLDRYDAGSGLDDVEILDDGQPNTSLTGSWYWESVGFNGDQYYALPGAAATGTWSFVDLPPGDYDVYATWEPDMQGAYDAPYTISHNGSTLATVSVDQRVLPPFPIVSDAPWYPLGTYTVGSGPLTVQIDAVSTGRVFDDAIRVVPHVPLGTGTDLRMKKVATNGQQLLVSYDVRTQAASAFNIGVYRSADGVTPGTLLTSQRVTDSGLLAVGNDHTVTVPLAFTDVTEDYYLVVVLDADDELTESVEDNNSGLVQGVFRTADGVVHIQGGRRSDNISISQSSTVSINFNNSYYTYNLADVTAVHVRGHDGNDYLMASSLTKPAWFFGGDGNDNALGGTANDYLDGGRDGDYLNGYGGNDTLVGGFGLGATSYGSYGGTDNLYGDDGDDLIFGDSPTGDPNLGEADTIYGGNGNDVVHGGSGADQIYLGTGHDTAYGGHGWDYIIGDEGNDTLMGGVGGSGSYYEYWYGYGYGSGYGYGGDTLLGYGGDDLLYGDHGPEGGVGGDDDYLDGGTGDDQLFDGDGWDTFDPGYGYDSPELIDNLNYNTYSSGSWTPVYNAGVNKHLLYAGASSGSSFSWPFPDVPSGTYELWATWVPDGAASTSASYTVVSNSTPVATFTANQQLTPGGDIVADRPWSWLGNVSLGGEAAIRLDASSIGMVMADAVLLNRAPTAWADSFTVSEDNIALGNVLTNDTDGDPGDTKRVTHVNGNASAVGEYIVLASGATLRLSSDGAYTYDPTTSATFQALPLGATANDSFSYTMTDRLGSPSSATVTITIEGANDAPVAVSDYYGLDEDATLYVPATGILGNDSGAALTAVLADPPQHGSVVLNTDGSFSYTPQANYNGADTFTYRAVSGGVESELATVTLAIAAIADAPHVDEVIPVTLHSNSGAYTIDLDVYFDDADIDLNGDQLTYTLLDNSNPGAASVVLNGNLLVITPLSGGVAHIQVQATDSQNNSVQTDFYLVVNNAPVVEDPLDDVVVDEDSHPVAVGLWDAFADVETQDQQLVFQVVNHTNPGLVAATINQQHGILSLAFAPQAFGNAVLTIQATDALGASVLGNLVVQVLPANDRPVGVITSNVLEYVEDTVGDLLDLSLLFDDLDETSSLTYWVADNTNPALIAASIALQSSNLSLAISANQFGLTTLLLAATDTSGATGYSAIDVNVSPVNDLPTVIPHDPIQVNEDSLLEVINLYEHFDDIEDADELLTFGIVGNTNDALVTAELSSSSGMLALKLKPDTNGMATITVRAVDTNGGSADLQIPVSVSPVDDLATNLTILEDSGATIVDLSGVFDFADNNWVYALEDNSNPELINAEVKGNSLVLLPVENASGDDIEVTVRGTNASTGVSLLRTLSITITEVNDLPWTSGAPVVHLNEGGQDTIDLKPLFHDVETAANELGYSVAVIDYSLPGNPVEAVFEPSQTGVLRLTALGDLFGYAQLVISATDEDAGSARTTLWVVINPVNDVPVASELPSQTFHHYYGWDYLSQPNTNNHVVVDLWQYFDDVEDREYLTYQASPSGNALVGSPVVTDGFLHYWYVTTPEFSGQSVITVTATDREGAVARLPNQQLPTLTVTVENYSLPNPLPSAPQYGAYVPEYCEPGSSSNPCTWQDSPDPKVTVDLRILDPWSDSSEDVTGVTLPRNADYDESNLTTEVIELAPDLNATVLRAARDDEQDRGLRHRALFASTSYWSTPFTDGELRRAEINIAVDKSIKKGDQNAPANHPDSWFDNYEPPAGTLSINVPANVKVWVPADHIFPTQASPNIVNNYGYDWRWIEYTGQTLWLDSNYHVNRHIPLLLEGMSNGTDTMTVAFTPATGVATSLSTLQDAANVHVADFDVDVDSNNDGVVNSTDTGEDELEYDPKSFGKRLPSSGKDRDNDGIPDYFDGFNVDALDDSDTEGPGTSNNRDLDNLIDLGESEGEFAQLIITIPENVDLEKARFMFGYSASDPALVGIQADGFRTLPQGGLRIWTKDQGEERSAYRANAITSSGDFVGASASGWSGYYGWHFIPTAGLWYDSPYDYVNNSPASDSNFYSFAQLGGSGRTVTLYVEGIRPGSYSIQVAMDADGIPDVQRDNGVPELDSEGNYTYDYPDVHRGFSFVDAVKVTVYDTVTIAAVDAIAAESSGQADTAQFRVSRGLGNTAGDLTVYYRLIIDPNVPRAVDPGVNPGTGDFNVTRFAVGDSYYYPGTGPWNNFAIYGPAGWTWNAGQLVDDPYTLVGSVRIAEGHSSADITIHPIDDQRVEWDEIVEIQLITEEEYHSYHDDPGLGRPELANPEFPTSALLHENTPNDGAPPSHPAFGDGGWGMLGFGGEYLGGGYYGAYHFFGLFAPYTGYLTSYSFGVTPPANLYALGESDRAEVTILDNDGLQTIATRNVDPASTGQAPADLGNGVVTVNVRDGALTAVLDLGATVPNYRANDNLHPIGVAEFELPYEQVPSALRGTLTFAGLAGAQVDFDLGSLTAYTALDPRSRVRLVLMGPADLAAKLSSGSYDFHIKLEATVEESLLFHRTIRGKTELVNRVDATLGTSEFGERWWLNGLDRIYPSDGITPLGDVSKIGTGSTGTSDVGQYSVNDLARVGAATESGLALIRGDNTSAWFKATPTSVPATIHVQSQNEGEVNFSDEYAWPATSNSFEVWPYWHRDRYSAAGLREVDEHVEWVFDELEAGKQYQIYVAFNPGEDQASNAPYTVSGANAVGTNQAEKTVYVNQQYKPGEYYYGGRYWRSIGFYVAAPETPSGTDATIRVKLSTQLPGTDGQEADDFADGLVVAGSVMLVDDWTFETPDGSFVSLQYGDYAGWESTNYWVDPNYEAEAGYFTLIDKFGNRAEFDPHGLLRGREDRNGNRVEFTYTKFDQAGFEDKLQTITRQGGLTTTYNYDQGKLTSIEDFADRITTFSIVSGKVNSVTQPAPNFIDYPGAASLPTLGTPVTTFQYAGPDGRLSKIVNAEGAATDVSYVAGTFMVGGFGVAGLQAWTLLPELAHGLAASSASGTLFAPSNGKIGNLTVASPLPQQLATYTDGANNPWLYQTDRFGYVTAHAQPPVQYTNQTADVWRWSRNEHGQPTSHMVPAGGGGYRENGETPLGEQTTRYSQYDALGNLMRAIYPDGTSESWAYFNAFSQVTSHTDRLGFSTTYSLTTDGRGNVSAITEGYYNQPGYRVTTFSYTPPAESISQLPGGLQKSVTLAGSTTQTDFYESGTAIGLPWRVYSGFGTSEVSHVTYTYDNNRNPATVVDERQRTTLYTYDALNRLVREVLPLPGAIVDSPEDEAEQGSAHVAPETYYWYNKVGDRRYMWDARGAKTETQYDGLHHVTSTILDTPGSDAGSEQVSATTQFFYDVSGNLWMTIDPAGNATTHVFDERHRKIKTTLPAPGVAALPGMAAEVAAAPIVHYAYDGLGQLAAQTDSRTQLWTTYRYNELGQQILVTLPATEDHGQPSTIYRYDNGGRLRFEISSGQAGLLVTERQYDIQGRVIKIKLPADGGGNVETLAYGYNERGQVTHQTDTYGNETVTEYDVHGRVKSVTSPTPGHSAAAARTTYEYTAAGEVRQVTLEDLGDAGHTQITRYTYDALGRVTSKTLPDPDGPGSLFAPKFNYTYNAAGDLLTTHDVSNNLTTTTSYDKLGRPWHSESDYIALGTTQGLGTHTVKAETKIKYDRFGRTVEERVANASYAQQQTQWLVTNYTYDALGRVSTVTGPINNSGQRPVTGQFYDEAGFVRYTVDPRNNVTEQRYDNLGRLKSIFLPDNPTMPAVVNNYNIAGDLISQTDIQNRTTTYDVDGRGRVITETLPTVGGVTPQIQRRYNLEGYAYATTDPEGNTTRGIPDNLGRTVATIFPSTGGLGRLEQAVAFDGLGRAKSSTNQQGQTSTFQHDKLNRQTVYTPPVGDDSTTTVYNDRGLVERVEFADGTSVKYLEYDGFGRPLEVEDQLGNVSKFAYDLLGNRTELRDASGNLTAFKYDNYGRMIEEKIDDGQVRLRSYGYDLVGNLEFAVDRNGKVRSFAYDAINRVPLTKILAHSSAERS